MMPSLQNLLLHRICVNPKAKQQKFVEDVGPGKVAELEIRGRVRAGPSEGVEEEPLILHQDGLMLGLPCGSVRQAGERSTKIDLLGPETGGWGGGSSAQRGGGQKVRSLLQKFVFLGFRGREPEMSRELPAVLDAWQCS